MISNSQGWLLAAHQAFESRHKAVAEEQDIDSATEIIESHPVRLRVRHTDQGRQIQQKIDQLQSLLSAYRTGLLKEQR